MDNKTSPEADEPSSTTLSATASKSQAQGKPLDEVESEERTGPKDRAADEQRST